MLPGPPFWTGVTTPLLEDGADCTGTTTDELLPPVFPVPAPALTTAPAATGALLLRLPELEEGVCTGAGAVEPVLPEPELLPLD